MDARLHSKPLIRGVDKPISALALGTAFFRQADRQTWFDLLDEFQQLGGTMVDSGRAYGDSEAVIGEWLETRRARAEMVLVTKCAHGQDAILPAKDFEQVVTRELETSLECLRTEYVDLYMLHRDNPAVPVGRIVERLNQEVERGRVRALGASNWTYERVNDANEYATQHGLEGFAVVSNNLSLAVPTGPFYPGLVSTDAAGEQWHTTTGTPLLSWSSQARGFFTGRYADAMQRGTSDGADVFTVKMVETYGTAENLERLRRAQELGARLSGYSAVQIALAWLLHKPFTLIPVVGPRTCAELTSCVEATSIELTRAQCAWVNLESSSEA
jgi:aryl-alcohol dehydrogenase-like predicted oxidoreductase